jgi:hypothetical protein
LLRADFASFVQHCFRELNPRTQFALSWHHEIIAAISGTARKGGPSGEEAVRNGHIRRLIINLPPREPNSLKFLSLGGHGWKIGWKILFSHRSGPP